MNSDYNDYGYGSDDANRYGHSRRRRSTPAAPETENETTCHSSHGSSGSQPSPTHHNDGERGSRRHSYRQVNTDNRPVQPEHTVRNRERTEPRIRIPRLRRPDGFKNIQTRFGTVNLRGKVLDRKQSQRRNDFFHVMWDTLVNGSRLSFSPVGQVITVELDNADYTFIDNSGRRTVIVKIPGKIFDGSVGIHDYVTVTGHWSRNNTVHASRIWNETNGSRLAVSHALPANLARVMTVLLLMGILALCFRFPVQSVGNFMGNLMGGLKEIVTTVLAGLLVLLLLLLIFSPGRGGFARSLAGIASFFVGLMLLYFLAIYYPEFLLYAVIIAVMCLGFWFMFRALRR